MWYLEPKALDILSRMSRPSVDWHEKTYILTKDSWGTFRSADFDKLRALWSRRGNDLVETGGEGLGEHIAISPEEVCGALFGDPNGNEHYRTFRDDSPEWEAIRVAVASALGRRAAA